MTAAIPFTKTGTCQLCGEPNVGLYIGEELPEEFEGIGCMSCCEFHAAEAEKRREREQMRKEARRS